MGDEISLNIATKKHMQQLWAINPRTWISRGFGDVQIGGWGTIDWAVKHIGYLDGVNCQSDIFPSTDD